ncbi:MAG: hypothetical protein RUMPE_00716 [Eubacteriales bacterium SKADARSKE-1]|nr:hypothetical protein [Eubacteriales bacterium SKADARSKE-1]
MKSSEFVKNNPELVKKAKECKSKEDFITLAKKNGIEFEDVSLETAYSFLHGDEGLSEDDLESVAGGKKSKEKIIIPEIKPLNSNEALSSSLTNLKGI